MHGFRFINLFRLRAFPGVNMRKKIGLGTKIIIGMVIGLIIGLILDFLMASHKELVTDIVAACQAVGDLFMKLLRMGVVPLIFVNIVAGVTQMDNASNFGKIGSKVLVFYVTTMLTATIWGLLSGFILNPGMGVTVAAATQAAAPAATAPSGFLKTILDFVPVNGIEAMATGKLVHVIVFAIMLGIAILQLPANEKARVSGWFAVLAMMMIRLIMLVMHFAPYGIAALTAVSVAKFGTSVFGAMAKFSVAIYLALLFQFVFVHTPLLYLFARIKPQEFLKKSMPIWITSMTTCSSQATLPVEMEISMHKMGLPARIVSFAQPLGATMNMDGNAIWMGVLAVFTSQIYGLPMDFMELVKVVLLGTVLVMGSPGIPGGIFVASTIFLTAMGYPLEVVPMLMGIFRIMDIGITTMNTLGDVVATIVVSASEKLFDRKSSPHWDAAAPDGPDAPDAQEEKETV